MNRAIDVFFDAIGALCKMCIVGQLAIISYVFAGRYFFNKTPGWGEPAALMCLVWMCILSSALSVRDDTHLRMNVIDAFVSERTKLLLDYLTLAVIGVFGAFMIYAGIQLTLLASNNKMPGIGIATSWLTLVVPLTGVAYFTAILDRLLRMKR